MKRIKEKFVREMDDHGMLQDYNSQEKKIAGHNQKYPQ